jgi:hypothetical protein
VQQAERQWGERVLFLPGSCRRLHEG